MRLITNLLGVILCAGICFGLSAKADEQIFVAQVKRPTASDQRIAQLTFKDEHAPVTGEFRNAEPQVYLNLEGKFTQKDWALIVNNKRVRFAKDGEFHFKIQLPSPEAKIELIAIAPSGSVVHETDDVKVENWNKVIKKVISDLRNANPFRLGLGFTSISFQQQHVVNTRGTLITIADFGETAITFRASYLRYLSERWDFGLSGYLTLLPITKQVSESVRFLGLNLRLGYSVPFVKSPWRLTVAGGYYYTTMFVSNNNFGFTNMAGPQVLVSLTKAFSLIDSAMVYSKFSPINGDGLGFLDLGNHETAVGLGYSRYLPNGHPISFTLDYSLISLTLNKDVIDDKTLSIGLMYGL